MCFLRASSDLCMNYGIGLTQLRVSGLIPAELSYEQSSRCKLPLEGKHDSKLCSRGSTTLFSDIVEPLQSARMASTQSLTISEYRNQ